MVYPEAVRKLFHETSWGSKYKGKLIFDRIRHNDECFILQRNAYTNVVFMASEHEVLSTGM